jgi:hypothetical protein
MEKIDIQFFFVKSDWFLLAKPFHKTIGTVVATGPFYGIPSVCHKGVHIALGFIQRHYISPSASSRQAAARLPWHR